MNRKSGSSYTVNAAPTLDLPGETKAFNGTDGADNDVAPSSGTTPNRGNWGNPVEFILSCMNFALGLGNVWRYPYLAFRNGGGAFIPPYILSGLFIGLPIFFLELICGQYSGLSPIKAFSYVAPLFTGLGYCTLVAISLVMIYYMVVVAWVIFYFWTSMWPSLAWGSCDNDWNTDDCYDLISDLACQEGNLGNANDRIFFREGCVFVQDICANFTLVAQNAFHCVNQQTGAVIPITDLITRTLSAEEFYYENVLGFGDASWTNFGYPRWPMVICLFIAWFLNFICLIGGVASVGKIVYFTATFPFFVLTALLVRGLTLEGSYRGIMFYITPDWEILLSPSVWGDASSQIFYSFSIGFGSLVTLASYNKFKNNCHFDATFVSFINIGTAIFAGFAIFSILGFLAHSMGIDDLNEVVSSGPGLSFIIFPEAILLMPGPQVWALLFFFMMLVLGLGSTFAGVQMMVASIIDWWPSLRPKTWLVTACVCSFCFLCGVPMTCHGGILLFTLFEWHTASWAILLIGALEVILFAWVYGLGNTFDLISEMGMKIWRVITWYWKSAWMVITPIGCIAIFIFVLTGIESLSFRGETFPLWADIVGWMIGTSTLICFPIFAIYKVVTIENKRDLLKPTENWGPQEVDGVPVDRT